MGPRFCKRGNMVESIRVLAARVTLQWGHAFVSVETINCVTKPARQSKASMGPRFCKRGNQCAVNHSRPTAHASMGPRFCKRGNDLLCRLSFGGDALQWGHAFVSVETSSGAKSAPLGGAASMGPRFCKRGNQLGCHTGVLPTVLQWGHAFVSVETASHAVEQVYHLSSPLRPEVVRQAHILAG